jgi:hypothetical protein
VSEAACPFCGAAFASEFRASPRPKGPGARLTRAALVAFGTLGTGSLAVLPACSSSSSAAPTGNGETDDSGTGTAMPMYGASPVGVEDASPGGNDGGTEGSDAEIGNPMPLYGAPAMHLDAGVDEGSDAEAGGPVATPLYGAPAIHPDAGDEIKDASEDHLTFVTLYGAVPH